jgi:hypothetical protein
MTLRKKSLTRSLFIESANKRGWSYRVLPIGVGRFDVPELANPILFKSILTEVTISPLQSIMSSKDRLGEYLNALSYPHPKSVYVTLDTLGDAEPLFASSPRLVAKPTDSSQGKGVMYGIDSMQSLSRLVQEISGGSASRMIVVQEDVSELSEYRISVLFGVVRGIMKRGETTLTGDGKSTMSELLAQRFESGKEKYITRTAESRKLLEETLGNVLTPAQKKKILQVNEVEMISNPLAYVKDPSSRVRIADVHPSIIEMAVKLCGDLQAPVAGIDLYLEDLRIPIDQQKHYIMEVNPSPGLGTFEDPAAAVEEVLDKIIERRT